MSLRLQKHDPDTKQLFTKRTFETCAGFIAPLLKPGISVIDCGCGPGNLTIELAKRATPGKVIGIDADASSIAMATQIAEEQGIQNVIFKAGDLYQLPYDDNQFDLAFSHAVLSNLQNPTQALKEYRRVVKPGGTVAVRESDYSGTLFYPENEDLGKMFDALLKVGELFGDLSIGKKLRQLFHDAGLKKITATASCESYGTPEALSEFAHYLSGQLKQEEVVNLMIQKQWANEEDLSSYQTALEQLSQHPGAFFAYNWVAATGQVEET